MFTSNACRKIKVPYWDFSAPGIPDAPVTLLLRQWWSSALLELSTYLPNGTGKRYKDAAIEMLASLNSDSYQSGKRAKTVFPAS